MEDYDFELLCVVDWRNMLLWYLEALLNNRQRVKIVTCGSLLLYSMPMQDYNFELPCVVDWTDMLLWYMETCINTRRKVKIIISGSILLYRKPTEDDNFELLCVVDWRSIELVWCLEALINTRRRLKREAFCCTESHWKTTTLNYCVIELRIMVVLGYLKTYGTLWNFF